jgi:DNA invertase Pin-like site-specific DNA recombinase
MTRAILYARFSPRPKVKKRNRIEDGETIELQFKSCRRYCEMRQLQVVEEIADTFESARTTPLFERPGGMHLRDLPEGVTHIITSKIDRLFRNMRDGLDMLDHWDAKGITIHFADQGGNSINVSTAMGRHFVRFMLSNAEFEADLTSERTSQMMQHRQKNGERMTHKNLVPYGKMVDPDNPDRIVTNPYELQMIDEVMLLREEGFSYRGICEQMEVNERQLRKGAWHPQKVKEMIKVGLAAASLLREPVFAEHV